MEMGDHKFIQVEHVIHMSTSATKSMIIGVSEVYSEEVGAIPPRRSEVK
jgi:hypothetical protein